MSDPFGSDGGPLPNPYDAHTHDPRGAQPSLDGISVAAFVCALSCCAAPVGIGLGIAGIVRTRDERRTGRWMAVTGLVLGVLLTVGLAAGTTGLVLLVKDTYFFEDARPGDCVDIEEENGGWLDISPASCDEPHDAEVVYSGRFTEPLRTSYLESDTFCHPLAKSAGYSGLTGSGTFWVDPIVESVDADDPELGDYFVCVAERIDGEQLTSPLSPGGDDGDDGDGGRETISSFDLERGDCFNEPEQPDDDLVGAVVRLLCTRPHDYQVIGNILLPDGEYPGEKTIDARTEECVEVFADFLGISYDDSVFEIGTYTPTARSWRSDGDRTITCLAEHPRGRKLTRDLEGIAR